MRADYHVFSDSLVVIGVGAYAHARLSTEALKLYRLELECRNATTLLSTAARHGLHSTVSLGERICFGGTEVSTAIVVHWLVEDPTVSLANNFGFHRVAG